MQTCIHSAFKDQKQKYHRGQKKDTVRIAQIDTAEILVNVQPKHLDTGSGGGGWICCESKKKNNLLHLPPP
jgi:hypothetical protein